MSWRIHFKDIEDRDIRIEIERCSEEASPTPVELTASSEPLVTDIDTEEDMLSPSRLSSGYITVVNEGNLSGLMPNTDREHSVKVYSNDALVWQGFMQSENYGRDMYLEHEDVKFAISDALSSLGSVDMSDMDKFWMQNMASFIHESCRSMETAYNYPSVSYVEIPNIDEFGMGVGGWLRMECQRKNFFVDNSSDNDDDPDWQKYDVVTYLQLLEEISRMMGYVVCLDGDILRFVSHKTSIYCRYTLTQIQQIGGSVDVSGVRSPLLGGVTALSGEQSASVDNTITSVRGKKLVKIKCDVNPVSDIMPDVSVSGLKYSGVRSDTSFVNDNRYRALVYVSKQSDVCLTEWQLFSDGSYKDIGYGSPGGEGLSFVRVNICKCDIFNQEDVENGSKTSYTYSEGILINLYGEQYSIPGSLEIVKITGGVLPPCTDGCICIDFRYNAYNEAERAVTCGLKIGNYWWTGSGWSTTSHKFAIRTKGGAVVTNKTINMLYEDASGFVMPIDQPLSGVVEFYLYYNTTSAGFGKAQLLSGLSVRYCNKETETADDLKDTNTYSSRTGCTSTDNASVTLKMATKTLKCKNGYGILYKNNKQVESGLVEKSLLSLMKEIYGKNRDEICPTLRCRRCSVGERFVYDGSTWQVLSESRNWRDSESKLLMYKI